MKTKRIVVIAVLAIGGLLVALAAVLLFRGVVQLRREHEALDRAERNLSRIYERNPFPSDANIEVERRNAATLHEWYDALAATLRERNIVSHEDSPSRFIRNFENTKSELRRHAGQRGVALTTGDEFAFGFDRYSGTGVLPHREHVAVLSEQLLIIERLCGLLFEGGIRALGVVRRDPVDQEAAPVSPGAPGRPPAPGGRPPPPGTGPARPAAARTATPAVREGEHFSRMQFRFEFTATEAAFLAVMNELVANRMFVMVDSVTFSKEVPEMAPAIASRASGPTSPAAEATEADLFFATAAATDPEPEVRTVVPIWKRAKAQRVISGPEHENPLQVSLAVSVYKFKGE